MAGLIKTVLAMNQGRIPRHLHWREPSDQIEWDRLPVGVTAEMTDWPATAGRRRLAAVNSFAISGANAHLVLEEHETRRWISRPGHPFQRRRHWVQPLQPKRLT